MLVAQRCKLTKDGKCHAMNNYLMTLERGGGNYYQSQPCFQVCVGEHAPAEGWTREKFYLWLLSGDQRFEIYVNQPRFDPNPIPAQYQWSVLQNQPWSPQ